MGVSLSVCQHTLEAMLPGGGPAKGAYLDVGRGLYVRHSRYAPQEEPDPAPQAASAPEDQSGKAKSAGQAAQVSGEGQQGVPSPEEMEYLDKLAQLRQVNQSIQSEKVSAQIERIQHITGNIFDIVVEHPERAGGQIHTFMNYYLPTALKLLCAYARLEKQKVAGENIQNSKEAIGKAAGSVGVGL